MYTSKSNLYVIMYCMLQECSTCFTDEIIVNAHNKIAIVLNSENVYYLYIKHILHK